MYVFGYGSLVWKADFPFENRIPGYVKGYVRRFWQGSHDHRGTESNPGRVVTLIPYKIYEQRFKSLDFSPHDDHQDVCWGVVYKIPDEHIEFVRAHLDNREKNGYDCFKTIVYTTIPIQHINDDHDQQENGVQKEMNDDKYNKEDKANTESKTDQQYLVIEDALIYVATTDNIAFLGPQNLEDMAHHISTCKGPSGFNFDYLFGLEEALKIIAPHQLENHISLLAEKTRQILKSRDTQLILHRDQNKRNLYQLHELEDMMKTRTV